MVMYGVYNSDILEDLINTVHKLHNKTTWNERLFAGQIQDWYHWYLTSRGVNQYVINSLLFLTTVREKYMKMYEIFTSIKTIFTSNKSFVKWIFAYISLITFKIEHHTT